MALYDFCSLNRVLDYDNCELLVERNNSKADEFKLAQSTRLVP